MRLLLGILAFWAYSACVVAQGTPPVPADQIQAPTPKENATPPSMPAIQPLGEVKQLVKNEINKAINGRPYPSLVNWRPLTTREKFDVFLLHTYSSRTFANAGIDALKNNIRSSNHEYETGWMGLGQRYGVDLATNETDIFFEQFLVPTLLKQDPRYFRNPGAPFLRRLVYSVSRVFITRSDNGHDTFNASKLIGGAMSEGVADLYVPGQRQGLQPIAGRVTFDLGRDAGMNLVHEFWPDIRHKFLKH